MFLRLLSEDLRSREFGATLKPDLPPPAGIDPADDTAGASILWRTHAGTEVDFVLEHGRKVLAIEVKRTTRPGYADAAGLRAFLAEYPQASGGLLIHSGRDIRRLDQNILAVPWPMITG